LEIVVIAYRGLNLSSLPNCTARAFDFSRHWIEYAPSTDAIKPKSSLPIIEASAWRTFKPPVASQK
jgi:hypothetical protein